MLIGDLVVLNRLDTSKSFPILQGLLWIDGILESIWMKLDVDDKGPAWEQNLSGYKLVESRRPVFTTKHVGVIVYKQQHWVLVLSSDSKLGWVDSVLLTLVNNIVDCEQDPVSGQQEEQVHVG